MDTGIAMVVTGATLQTVALAMIGPTDMGCAEISLPMRDNHVTKACHNEKWKAEITRSAQLKNLSINPLRRGAYYGSKPPLSLRDCLNAF